MGGAGPIGDRPGSHTAGRREGGLLHSGDGARAGAGHEGVGGGGEKRAGALERGLWGGVGVGRGTSVALLGREQVVMRRAG